MIFSTASDTPRPIRLREEVRAWAWESLHGKYGDEAMANGCVYMDDVPGFARMSDFDQYDIMVRKIVEEAPVRICPYERISGAATLGDGAIMQRLPARFEGEWVMIAGSHLTIRFDKVLKEGMDAYGADIAARSKDSDLTEKQKRFLQSLENSIESMRIWHGRYLEAVKEKKPEIYKLLKQVPFKPARNFHEAVQSLWFTFAFTRLFGYWSGIGRIDWLLGDYLKKDLQEGVLDLAEAREILASFFIKGCEWIRSHVTPDSGDAQHYQNIVLAGIDEDGEELANEVTYLVLDIVEELSISDFPITMRLRQDSPVELKKRVAEVIRHGGGIVAVYNEPLVLNTFRNQGYPEKEARMFANDGCWEVLVPGKSDFSYKTIDALQVFNRALGLHRKEPVTYTSLEEIYQAFLEEMKVDLEDIYKERVTDAFEYRDGQWQGKGDIRPTSVFSLFLEGCIRNARGYMDLGPEYTVRSPHIGGAPDAANSFYALHKLVFEEQKITLPELVDCLKHNWEGNELLRLYVRNNYIYYGNDSDEVDQWYARILDDFAAMVEEKGKEGDCPVKLIPGVSTFGRQLEWIPKRFATVFGYRKGDILSGNASPVPGTDFSGATSIIKSYCKADLVKQTCGAALDIKLLPDCLRGDKGITALVGLIDGFLALGGFFMQLDTLDVQTLLEAKKHPENFKTLSVRVSGWNARFVTLNEDYQNMVIERTTQKMNES